MLPSHIYTHFLKGTLCYLATYIHIFERHFMLPVVTYPSAGVQKGQDNRPKCLSPREKTSGVATNIYLRKTLEKPKRRRSAYFENEGSGVVYARGRY